MDRPTLEEQIRINKMTDEECIRALMTPLGWIHNHCLLVWRIIRWNWFNIWTGEEGFILFAKHKFREWGKPS